MFMCHSGKAPSHQHFIRERYVMLRLNTKEKKAVSPIYFIRSCRQLDGKRHTTQKLSSKHIYIQ